MNAKSNKIIIETTITERIHLPVRHPLLGSSADFVAVDVCVRCGAMVGDFIQHYLWHQQMENQAGDVH